MTVKELAEMAGVSKVVVYKCIHRIEEREGKARLPTLEELKNRKVGRPLKFKSEGE